MAIVKTEEVKKDHVEGVSDLTLQEIRALRQLLKKKTDVIYFHDKHARHDMDYAVQMAADEAMEVFVHQMYPEVMRPMHSGKEWTEEEKVVWAKYIKAREIIRKVTEVHRKFVPLPWKTAKIVNGRLGLPGGLTKEEVSKYAEGLEDPQPDTLEYRGPWLHN